MMNKMKKGLLIVFICGYSMILLGQIMMFVLFPNEELATFIPGFAPTDFFILATLQPLYLIAVYLVFGDLMATLYFPLHKIIKFNRFDYKNIEPGPEFNKINYFYRLLITALFCYSLLIMLQLFISPAENYAYFQVPIIPSMALNLLLLPVSCLVVSGNWILQDTGMICVRKKKYINQREPTIIEGVGRYYSSAWAGFVGFATPIGLAIEIYKTFVFDVPWQGTLSLIIQPFIMMCLLIPVTIIHDSKITQKRKKFINKWKLEVLPRTTFEI